MNRKQELVAGILIVSLTIFNLQSIRGQNPDKNKLYEEAMQSFNSKDYAGAFTDFQQLLNMYPKEPEYQYYSGICLLRMNRQLDKAIAYLAFAASKNATKDAYYYLGRAYHLNYQFDDAVNAYKSFERTAPGRVKRKFNTDHLIEMAENGKELTLTGQATEVVDTSHSSLDKIEAKYTINNAEGKLIYKPKEFYSKNDIKNGYRSLLFLPASVKTGEYIYVSGYSKNIRHGKEIFRIKKIDDRTWSEPEVLDNTINTDYDEEYPYFDRKSSTLYFSSKGHNSMGGYDIFKSTYDSVKGKWSEPVNIGFPVNSPYDDFLYITSKDNQLACFSSSRAEEPGHVTIYTIKLNKTSGNRKYATLQDIQQAAALSISNEPDNFTSQRKPVETETVKYAANKNFDELAYKKLIGDALGLQLEADSLSRQAREKRLAVKETKDEEIRKQLFSDISALERNASAIQKQADEKYARAAAMKKPETLPENTEKEVTSHQNDAVELKEEINGIKVYQYKPSAVTQEPEFSDTNTMESKPEPPTPVKEEIKKSPEKTLSDNFQILPDNAYSDTRPIPENPPLPMGLVYRIQLGAFSKPVTPETFKGVQPVSVETNESGNLYKYFAGYLISTVSANKALQEIRNYGFPDAFIVAYFNREKIPVEQARKVEFEKIKF